MMWRPRTSPSTHEELMKQPSFKESKRYKLSFIKKTVETTILLLHDDDDVNTGASQLSHSDLNWPLIGRALLPSSGGHGELHPSGVYDRENVRQSLPRIPLYFQDEF